MTESVELVSTYVSVGISTEGLGRELVKQTRGLSNLFGSIGKSSGAQYKSAFAGASKDATKPAQQDAEALAKTVKSNTAKVAAARTAEAAAARKVSIEEAKLDELRAKGNAKASQILAAEDRVANARTKHAVATEKVTIAVGGLEDAQRALRDTTAQVEQATGSLGSKLKAALSGANPFTGLITSAKAFGTEAQASLGKVAAPFRGLGGEARTAVAEVGRNLATIGQPAISALQGLATRAVSTATTIGQAFQSRLAVAGQAIGARLDPFVQLVGKARARAGEAATAFGAAVSARFQAIGARLDPFVQAVGRAKTRAVEAATSFGNGVITRAKAIIAPFAPFGPVVAKAASAAIEAGKTFGGGILAKTREAMGALAARFGRDGADTGRRFSEEAGRELSAGGQRAGGLFRATFLGGLAVNVVMGAVKKVTGAISGAFSGGWNRLLNIEEAESKLSTIFSRPGVSAEQSAAQVKAAMSSVDESVTGTRFAISDAADMAAQLGAAGVKTGTDMTRWLKLTADAAQFSNAEFSAMQPLMQEVAAQGKVTGEHLNRFPLAASALSDSLGVSQAEVRKLASEGKISAEQFATALEKRIGGAASNAGASFSSMAANLKTAMNAGMADILKPFKDLAMPLMRIALGFGQGIRDGITKPLGEGLGNLFKPITDRMNAAFSVESVRKKVGDWTLGITQGIQGVASILGGGKFLGADMTFGLEEDSPVVGILFGIRDGVKLAIDGIKSVFGGVKDAAGGFVEGFGGMETVVSTFRSLLPVLMGPLGILKSALMQVFGGGGAGIDMAGFGETLGAAVGPILQMLGELAGMITGLLAEALAELLPVLMQVGSTLLSALGPVLMQLVPIIGQLATTLLPVFASLFQSLIPVVLQLVTAIMPLVAMLVAQLAPVLLNIISALLPPLGLLLQAVASVIGTLVQALAPVITALVGALAPIISTLVQALLPPLANVIAMVAEVIATVLAPILNVIINVLGKLLVGAINALMPVVEIVFGFIAKTIGNVMNFVSGVIRLVMAVIRGDWSGAWNAIQQIGAAIWNQIRTTVQTAIGLVMAIIRGVLTTIQTIWNAAWEVIKGVGQAAWDWINRGINAFGDGARNLFQGIVDGIGRIWNGLRDVAAAPVRFVIDTVINDGIIKGWNDLVGLLKLPDSLRVGRITVPGFRKGGYTGDGRDDEWAGGVHRNEYVFDADTVRAAGGPSTLDVMRERLRSGRWPVGAAAEVPGRRQNTLVQGLPLVGIPGLPTDVKRIAREGPQRGDGGEGGPVDWGMGRVGSYGWYRRCLAFVNAAWGYGVGRFRLATARQSQNAGPRTMTGTPPAGAGVYWDTGGYAGHISLAVGDGTELSNDIIVPGRIDRVQSRAFRDRWGARYMGWWHPGGAAGGPGGPGPDGGGPSLAEMLGGWITDKITTPVKALLNRVPGVGVFTDVAEAIGSKIADLAIDKIKSIGFGGDEPAGYWTGTYSASPGWRLVGERGAELVKFRGGEQVANSPTTDEVLGDLGAGGSQFFFQPQVRAGESDLRREFEDFMWRVERAVAL